MKVKIDNNLKNICVPLNVKNIALCDNYLTRGTKIPVKSDKIRVFIAWKAKDNKKAQIDLDLGCSYNNGESVKTLDWRNRQTFFGKHSGDFTFCRDFNPKTGIITAEYIDIDLNKLKSGFITFNVIIYNGLSFDEFDAYFGYLPISENPQKALNLNDAYFTMKLTGKESNKYVGLSFDVSNKNLIVISEFVQNTSFGSTSDNINNDFYNNYYKNIKSLYWFFEKYCEAKFYDIVDYNYDILVSATEKGENVYNISEHSKELEDLFTKLI